jgi:hypothetical protein
MQEKMKNPKKISKRQVKIKVAITSENEKMGKKLEVECPII